MASSAHWTVQLELLTPAFIGGARPRVLDPVTPLRPTALRGVWRQWFRYASGAVLAPSSLKDGAALALLRKLEDELFGNTEQGSVLVVGPAQGGRVRDFRVPNSRERPGQRYLGYGVFDAAPPQCLVTNDAKPITFRVGLRCSGAGRASDVQLEQLAPVLAATLWLWAHFGGIGARCRRGWGAAEITRVGDTSDGQHKQRSPTDFPWKGPAFGHRAESIGELLKNLSDGLDEVLRVFGELCTQRGHRLPARDQQPLRELRTVAGIDALRALPITWDAACNAMEVTGRLFQDFRSTPARSKRNERPHSDYFDVKAAIQGQPNAPTNVVRAAFGLPLPFYFRSLGGRKTTIVPVPDPKLEKEGKLDRLPSPLLFRPHRLTDAADNIRRFAMTLVDLAESSQADHLAGHQVRLNNGSRAQRVPDGQIVADFMRWAIEQAPLYDERLRAEQQPGGRRRQ